MADGRRRDAWDHTSCVLAILSRRGKPSDFHPFHRRQNRFVVRGQEAADLLKALFVDRR